MEFVSFSLNNNTNSSNEAVNTAFRVTIAGTQVNDANSTNNDNLSNAIICAFLASQSNSSQLVNEDLEQIHLDDLEEMDLKWQMAMLTMRARRFLKNIKRKLKLKRNEKTLIKPRNMESTRRNVPDETTNSSTLLSCDGLGGYDWSDQDEEGPNYALMAYSTSSFDYEVSTDFNCSKTCLKTVETLKSQNEQLLKDLKKSELMVLGYKDGLKSVEERLKFFKTNDSIYSEDIKILKFEIHCNEITIRELRKKLETVQREKDGIQLTVKKLENASKSLFMPRKPDLPYIGLEGFTSEPVVETLNAKTNKDVPKRAIDTKWFFKNKKAERGIVIRNKASIEDLDFLDKVYKVEKALYGLHQAPRAWYETFSMYLLENGFHNGKIDKTLFIRRHKDDILLVQVYIDDIIFGSTQKELCNTFEKMMHEKFQTSSMGELLFFLGLQVKQKQDRIVISQDKYAAKTLKKYGFSEVKTASTPMKTQKPLLKD
nr:ribonuclease H-like domain-containing protein [Tanacetum cinerariifolium]